MYRPLAVIAVLMALVMPLATAIGMQVPPDMDDDYVMDIGDTEDFSITVVGDQNTNEIQFFVDIRDDIARVDGNTYYVVNETIGPNERRTFDFEIEAVEAGQARVEYGFTYSTSNSGNIGFQNVNSDSFLIEVLESDEEREERLRSERNTTTEPTQPTNQGTGGNSGTGVDVNTGDGSQNNDDAQVEDTSPQSSPLTQIQVDDSARSTNNQNRNTRSTGDDEGIGFLITILAASVVAAVGGVGAFRYGRKNDIL